MPKRERMLDISNISRNNNYLASTKLSNNNPAKTEITLTTCKVCNKEYNQQKADSFLSNLNLIPGFAYQNTCLACIQESSNQIKANNHQRLAQLRRRQDIINKVYQESYNTWKAASNEYQALDYQASLIKHHLTKPTVTKKSSTKKKDKTPDQSKKATALKILSKLTPDQQEAIIAMMAKGT